MGSTIENVSVLPEGSCRAAAEEISVTKTTLEVRLRERPNTSDPSAGIHPSPFSLWFLPDVGHGDATANV